MQLVIALFFLGLMLCLQGYFLWKGLRKSADQLVLFDVYINLAILTLGLAPAIWYLQEALSKHPESLFFQMKVNELHYFAYVLPSFFFLTWGLKQSKSDKGVEDQNLLQAVQQQLRQEPYLPWVLFFIGGASQLSSLYLPYSLQQLGYLGSLVTWVGALHLLFAPIHTWLKLAAGLVLITYLVLLAIQSTFFGGLIFWPLLLGLYVQLRYRFSLQFLISAGVGALLVVFLLFSFKYEYRSRLWQEPGQKQYLKHLWGAIKHPWQYPEAWGTASQTFLTRINQGKHLAMVYNWIPQHQPYAKGKTLAEAIGAALVPRVFWPDKPVAADPNKLRWFTGHQFGEGTSANIGIMGETYGNFGFWLGLPFLWLWSRGLKGLYQLIQRLAFRYYPCLWLWVPLIFNGLIDQENDFVTQLNHAVKGTIFTMALCWVLFKIPRFLLKGTKAYHNPQ